MKKLLLAMSLLLTMTACGQQAEIKSNIPSAVEAELDGYDFLESSDNIMSINLQDLLDLKNNGTAIVVIGTSNCPNCQQAMPDIQSAAIKNSQIVYYLDISTVTSEEDFASLISAYGDYMQPSEYDPESKAVYIPHIMTIKNGEVIQSEIGYEQNFDYGPIMNFEINPDIQTY